MIKVKKMLAKILSICLLCSVITPQAVFADEPVTEQPVSAEQSTSGSAISIDESTSESAINLITPQEVNSLGDDFELTGSVYLYAAKDADKYAVSDLKKTLTGLGVQISDTNSTTEAAIYIGKDSSDDTIKNTLKSLSVDGTDKIEHEESYVLASKNVNNKEKIVLAGKDDNGTFYAVQTLKQIISKDDNGSISIPEVEIRDYPTMSIRGTIEGFYGAPWSNADRVSQFKFYGQNKMNTYIYSAKDDDYLRANWQTLYPADKLNDLKNLVESAVENHVNFVYAISPGLSIFNSDDKISDDNFNKLTAKAQQMYDIGVRSFAIFLDDIVNYSDSNRDYHTGAQIDLLNRFENEFVKKHAGIKPLITVPTDYCTGFMKDSNGFGKYSKDMGAGLDPDIVIMWSGSGVVSSTISKADVDDIKTVYPKNKIFVWYNYPVNDMAPNRLFLGPATGLNTDLSDAVSKDGFLGLTSNPMIQAEPSKIAIGTVGDFNWNPAKYDSDKSWENMINEIGGTHAKSLYIFADSGKSSLINNDESSVLNNYIQAFWKKYNDDTLNQDTTEYKNLIQSFKDIEDASSDLESNMANSNFVNETSDYLNKLKLLGQAGQAGVNLLCYAKENDMQSVWKYMLQFKNMYNQIEKMNAEIGTQVIVPFLGKVSEESNKYINFSSNKIGAFSSFNAYQDYTIDKMIDGDENSFYWTNSPASADSYFGIDLGRVKTVYSVKVMMGKDDSEGDIMAHGRLEYSKDNKIWIKVVDFDNKNVISVNNLKIQARYLRCRATKDSTNWVKVREFEAEVPDDSNKTSGTPIGSSDSPIANMVDGDITTAYKATTVPKAGDEMICSIPSSAETKKIVILQDPNTYCNADVSVKNEKGNWVELGKLDKGYNKFGASFNITDIKMKWDPSSSSPIIYEIIPLNASNEYHAPVVWNATASSALDGWPASNACDNNFNTSWSSENIPNTDGQEWLMLDAGKQCKMNGVTLVPRTNGYCFPKSFKFQYSNDGNNWTNIDGQDYKDYSDVSSSDPGSFSFDKPVIGRYIRILITKLTCDDNKNYYCQLAEFNVDAEYVEGNVSSNDEFTIKPVNSGNAFKLDRTSGIEADVNVVPIEGTTVDRDNDVVVFQLMKGTIPESIIAIKKKDIPQSEVFSAYFNVSDYDNDNYSVKVFVLDNFNKDVSVPTSIAEPVELK